RTGLRPGGAEGGLAAAFLALLLPAGRAGAAAATSWLARGAPPGAGRPIERLLRSGRPGARAPRLGKAPWRRAPSWVALWLKDLVLSTRPGAPRARLVTALLLAVASSLAWRLPTLTGAGALADPRLAAFLAFAGALLAAAAFAEWIVELCGSDPFAVVRSLPIGVGALWSARFASALSAALFLAGLHAALCATVLPPIAWGPPIRLE